jgi:hypothetical protein
VVLTRDSSVVLVVRTFLRCHKVIHLRLHHTFSLGGWTPLFPGEEEVAAAMVAAITDQRERTGGGRRSMQ